MAVRRCDGWKGHRSSRQDYRAAKRIESARVLWPVRLEPARLVAPLDSSGLESARLVHNRLVSVRVVFVFVGEGVIVGDPAVATVFKFAKTSSSLFFPSVLF